MSTDNNKLEDRLVILDGHVMDRLSELPDESIHMCVTSPPYFSLRDYKLQPQVWGGDPHCRHSWRTGRTGRSRRTERDFDPTMGHSRVGRNYKTSPGEFCRCRAWRGCLGLEPTLDLYIEHIVESFREVWRVLRSDGSLWLNMGDCYEAGTRADRRPSRSLVGYAKHGYWTNPVISKRVTAGLKAKSLIGLPWLVAFALRENGWSLRSDIIWSKPSAMPGSQTDRPTTAHEYVFLFAKNVLPVFWTHRDGWSTRKQPKPDFRWTHARSGEEVTVAPTEWRTSRIPCPTCVGTGEVQVDYETPLFGTMSGSDPCERCAETDDHTVPEWSRVNLWAGDDYFYDGEAVKEPSSPKSHARYGRGRSNNHKYADGGPGNQTLAKTFAHMRKPEVNPKAIIQQDERGRSRQNENFSSAVKDLVGSRSLRTVWTIPAQPLKAAHFAAFPEALVDICVRVGTSAYGACSICGAPYKRVLKPTEEYARLLGRDWSNPSADDSEGRGHFQTGNGKRATQRPVKRDSPSVSADYITVGWQPTCEHSDAGVVPCTVLDPFGGSGRTGKVALELGRKAVLIELSPEYLKIINRLCETTFGLALA